VALIVKATCSDSLFELSAAIAKTGRQSANIKNEPLSIKRISFRCTFHLINCVFLATLSGAFVLNQSMLLKRAQKTFDEFPLTSSKPQAARDAGLAVTTEPGYSGRLQSKSHAKMDHQIGIYIIRIYYTVTQIHEFH